MGYKDPIKSENEGFRDGFTGKMNHSSNWGNSDYQNGYAAGQNWPNGSSPTTSSGNQNSSPYSSISSGETGGSSSIGEVLWVGLWIVGLGFAGLTFLIDFSYITSGIIGGIILLCMSIALLIGVVRR